MKGFPGTRAQGTLFGGTQVAERLAKDPVVNEAGSGSPGWQLAGCRAQGDCTTEVKPVHVQTLDRRVWVRISAQGKRKHQATRGELPGKGPAGPGSGMRPL